MNWLHDVRFAVHSLLKHPGFTAAALLTLMLGIGMNTAVFTLVNAVILRGLPFEEGHRIIHIECRNPSQNRPSMAVSYPEYQHWKEAEVFSEVAAYERFETTLEEAGRATRQVRAAYLTHDALHLLRVNPVRGRGFLERDAQPSASPVALLSYSIWRERYAGRDDVLGREVSVGGQSATVVGVLPRGFHFPLDEDLWLALRPDDSLLRPQVRRLRVFARMAAGAQLGDVRGRLEVLSARLEQAYPESNQGVEAVAEGYNDKFNGGGIRVVFLTLLFAVGFLLLIVCANLANMTLVRAFSRTRELAVRSALGASRWKLQRRMLTESVLLALVGGAAGMAVAFLVVDLFSQAVANVEGTPYWIEFTFDPAVFAYLFAVCLATGLVFGAYPAWKAARADLNHWLKEGQRTAGGRSSRRFASALVVGQMAFSVLLLVGAGLLARSFVHLLALDTGVQEENLLTLRLRFPDSDPWTEGEHRLQFLNLLQERLQGLAGVQQAALGSHLPLGGAGNWPLLLPETPQPEDAPSRLPSVPVQVVSEGYFQTMGSPLRAGRGFTASDGGPSQPVAIVNQAFLRRWRESVAGVGGRFRLYEGGNDQPGPWLRVVGVAPDIRHNSPSDPEVLPLVYLPLRHFPLRSALARLRVPGDPYSAVEPARGVLREMHSRLLFADVTSLKDQLWRQTWPYRTFGGLFALFALTALVLSLVGAYSLAAHAVEMRYRELGIRMALGATPRSLRRLVLRSGVLRLALGLVLGLALAVALSRVLHTLLVGVEPTDPLVFSAALALITICGLAACLLPARRAARLDPVEVLQDG